MGFIRKIIFSFIPAFLILQSGCKDDSTIASQNVFVDPRDGQTYKITTIGDQTWFAENLRFHSDDISSVCYNDEETNCFLLGRLYDSESAKQACPEGWHLPSIEEWKKLVDYFGGQSSAPNYLKPFAQYKGDLVEINLVPGGYKFIDVFGLKGDEGRYWTSTKLEGMNDTYMHVTYIPDEKILLHQATSSSTKQSCRCIKD